MRRGYKEILLSAGTLVLLLLALVAVDERVRAQVMQRFMTQPNVELASAGHQVSNLTNVIVQAARDQSLANAPMLIFAVAATILVIFMLRT